MGKFDGVFLASDMDGTLLDDNREIGAKTIEALNYFTQNGGYFALATGRTRPGTDAYRPLLPCNCPGVYLNGAIICDERNEELMFMEGLDEDAKSLAKDVISKFPHIGVEIFLLDRSYVCSMNEVTREHFEDRLKIPYQVVDIDDVPEKPSMWGKINFTGEPDEVGEIQEYLRPAEESYNLTFSTPVYYEMTCKGGHKGDGVLRAASFIDVARENIYVAGDSMNDVPMLRVAGTAFVPENGREDVKAMDGVVVVADNNHDTLADIVAHLDRKY